MQGLLLPVDHLSTGADGSGNEQGESGEKRVANDT